MKVKEKQNIILLILLATIFSPCSATYRQLDLSTDPSLNVQRIYNGDPRPVYQVTDYRSRTTTEFILPEPIDDQLERKFRRDTDVDSWDDEYYHSF